MKHIPRIPVSLAFWARLAALAVLVLAALVAVEPPALATVLPWLSLEEIAGRAEVIAYGKVIRTEGGWSGDGRIIVTRVTLEIERAIKGGRQATVSFEVPGGKADGQIMIASGAPSFRIGERAVLFLEPAGVGASARMAVVGWNLGAMQVERDPYSGRDMVRDRTGNALYVDREGHVVRPQPRPGGPAELGRFLDEVARLVRAGGAP